MVVFRVKTGFSEGVSKGTKMTKFNAALLLGCCADMKCGDPIYGAPGQPCPKFCIKCAVERMTKTKAPQEHPGDPRELYLGVDRQVLRGESDENDED